MNKDIDEFKKGTVIEALPNTMFRIKFENDKKEGEEKEHDDEIVYLSGRMKKFRIRILVGDKVEIKIEEYGGRGKIVKRL